MLEETGLRVLDAALSRSGNRVPSDERRSAVTRGRHDPAFGRPDIGDRPSQFGASNHFEQCRNLRNRDRQDDEIRVLQLLEPIPLSGDGPKPAGGHGYFGRVHAQHFDVRPAASEPQPNRPADQAQPNDADRSKPADRPQHTQDTQERSGSGATGTTGTRNELTLAIAPVVISPSRAGRPTPRRCSGRWPAR